MSNHNFPFTMEDILNLLGWDADGKKGTRKAYQCPFCNDRRRHMSVDFEENTFLCYRCGSHGGMLALFREARGLALNNYETALLIKRELNMGDGVPAPHSQRNENRLQIPENKQDNPYSTRTAEELDAAYRAFLDELLLSRKHMSGLKERGLSEREILQDGYKSVPTGDFTGIARKLTDRGLNLNGIPGFFTIKSTGQWSVFIAARGFFIPVRNLAGQITGMQIRLDEPQGKSKYRWFSSNQFQGHRLANGTKAKGGLHFVGNFQGGLLLLTEGCLKANVAHHLLQRLPGITENTSLIAYQGVGALGGLEQALASLSNRGFSQVMEFNDRDKVKNDGVRVATKRLYEMVGRSLRKWPYIPDYLSMDPGDYLGKGLDDHLLQILSLGGDADCFLGPLQENKLPFLALPTGMSK